MELEAAREAVGCGRRLPLRRATAIPRRSWRPSVDDVRTGAAPGLVAARFQHAVVDLVVATVRRLREETGVGTATLSGGVFLNAFLTAACATALEADGFEVLRHRVVPASDAGIALGQLAVLAHRGRTRPPRKRTGEVMCLAVPGQVLEIEERDGTRIAQVDFGGVTKEVCLEYVPDLQVGEYTIVHVGFALQRLDEQSALETLELFRQMGDLNAEFGDHWGMAAEQAGLPRPDLAPVMSDVPEGDLR